MSYSYAERKRIRKTFERHASAPLPYLLGGQFESYDKFLYPQKNVKPSKAESSGLEKVLRSVFPIRSRSGTAVMEYVSYELEEPRYTPDECRMYGDNYASGLRAKVRLVFYHPASGKGRKPSKVREVKEDTVFLGEVPRITDRGSFIVNGTERVVVSQLRRSPGVIFDSDRGRTHSSGKLLYTSRIVPHRGAWLDFEFDIKDHLHVRIDRKRKVPATIFLRAFGYDNREILDLFYETNHYRLKKTSGKSKSKSKDASPFVLTVVPERLIGQELSIDIVDKSGKTLAEAGRRITGGQVRKITTADISEIEVEDDYLLEERLAEDLFDPATGEIFAHANQEITPEIMEQVRKAELQEIHTLYFNDVVCGPFVSDTLLQDRTTTREEALVEIYRVIRPGEPTTGVQAEQFFTNMFLNPASYDLSRVGRMKMDLRLWSKYKPAARAAVEPPKPNKEIEGGGEGNILHKEDVVRALQILVDIRNGKDSVDDIDHLGNRRVRTVGEMVADQVRIGLTRVEKVVAERLASPDASDLTPQDLVNSKPVSAAVREFYNGNQLSQFMDQINPLSEIAHKRRLSAMGTGGLTRERAGYEVRDVHPTHYGRLCPIETPEGPNIGLISSLGCYARINEYGFIETPYRKVEAGRVTEEIVYLSPLVDNGRIIAQASAATDADGHLTEAMVPVRAGIEFTMRPPQEVELMDISPRQIISVAAALIPFIEHNDANRALMGSNMQRQAIPTLIPEKPLVGTGLEAQVARDSGVCVLARRAGIVDQVDASRIVVRATDLQAGEDSDVVDIYSLCKYQRTNQDTCSNQRPLVRVGDKVEADDVLADGSSVDKGELALGRNVRVAFLPWNGYNFEDSIVLSEQLARNDTFTSIHIKQLSCTARETRLGDEEITADIPGVSDSQLSKLDENGIVHIGAEVNAGDILVGRITPKSETLLTPEERLLRTVFGDKAANVKDTSLYVPHGSDGTVIDVQVLTRPTATKDSRTLEIERLQLEKLQKDLEDELNILQDATYSQIGKQLVGHTVVRAAEHKEGAKITAASLKKAPPEKWHNFRVQDEDMNRYLNRVKKQLKKHKDAATKRYKEREDNLGLGKNLPPGVIRIVKIFLAIRRRLQPGDKMAGRHGNKGVISAVMPIEDMPYDSDGQPVDIVLNPLGIPSRMNIGQIFETHLGWALKALGEETGRRLDAGQSAKELRPWLQEIYSCVGTRKEQIETLDDTEVVELAENLRGGIPVATPAFDGASEEQVRKLLKMANLPEDGRTTLYDGRTGRAFDNPVTVGYAYMLKLNHLVEDKMHARSTGSYSLVTQQPLGGKAQLGGQRFGEMEVWALKAYGAAHTLREMLTVKSDDIQGRAAIYRNIINSNYRMDSEIPESFNVLVNEIRALGINLNLEMDSPTPGEMT